MKVEPKKVLLIGIDQSIPSLINRFLDEDTIPNIKKLKENGVYTEAYSCPPCDTPTNWTTIATGATTAVHGATSFYLHIPGETFELGMKTRSRTSLSRFCKAEYIWDVADRKGLRSFVMNYPAGWPSKFKNGAMSLYTWPLPESSPRILAYPKEVKVSKESSDTLFQITEAEELPEGLESKNKPLQFLIQIAFKYIKEPVKLNCFILSTEGKKYNTIVVPTNSAEKWINIQNIQSWSKWINVDVETSFGKVQGLLKVKIIDLLQDGNKLTLQISDLYNTKGWTDPEDIAEKIIKNAMILESIMDQEVDYMISGKVKSYLLFARREAVTISRTLKYMKDYINWNLCYFHIHSLDSVNHRTLAFLYEKSPLYSEEAAEEALEYVKTSYIIIDELVGNLLKSCVDEETIVIYVSDHGAIPSWRVANIPLALMKSNLLSYKWENKKNKFVVDWEKTIAFPYLEPPYVWVNLKGRDPKGIVDPEDYNTVRENIIKALYEMRDPDTGKQIIKLALKKEEAAFLGQNGDRVGDVVYYLHPSYLLFDGSLDQLNTAELSPRYLLKPEAYMSEGNFAAHAYYLPTQKLGEYSISVPLIIQGPSIQKGIELKNSVNLIDIAPTIAELLKIPNPKNSQGRILHEIFN
jgi:predicted AlkP superfamily phosphohydrolase/phosphomutase